MSNQVGTWLRFPENTPRYDYRYLVLTKDKRRRWGLYLAEFWKNDFGGAPMWFDLEMGEVDDVVAFCDVNMELGGAP